MTLLSKGASGTYVFKNGAVKCTASHKGNAIPRLSER